MKILKKLCLFMVVVTFIYFFIYTFFTNDIIYKRLIYNDYNEVNNLDLEEIIEDIFYSKYINIDKEEKDNKSTILKPNKNSPIIYIYNTHDMEEYSSLNEIKLLGISENVVTASYMLQELLSSYGINSIVEEKSPTKEVKQNNLSYPSTYTFSYNNAIDAKNKNKSLEYFIDLHRDGVKKEYSTVQIQNKSYAKIMFVLGMDHENSEKNLELVSKLEEYLNNNYAGILRKTSIYDDSSYNQELSEKAFLVEMGGNENNLNEVFNSMKALANAIAWVINNE